MEELKAAGVGARGEAGIEAEVTCQFTWSLARRCGGEGLLEMPFRDSGGRGGGPARHQAWHTAAITSGAMVACLGGAAKTVGEAPCHRPAVTEHVLGRLNSSRVRLRVARRAGPSSSAVQHQEQRVRGSASGSEPVGVSESRHLSADWRRERTGARASRWWDLEARAQISCVQLPR